MDTRRSRHSRRTSRTVRHVLWVWKSLTATNGVSCRILAFRRFVLLIVSVDKSASQFRPNRILMSIIECSNALLQLNINNFSRLGYHNLLKYIVLATLTVPIYSASFPSHKNTFEFQADWELSLFSPQLPPHRLSLLLTRLSLGIAEKASIATSTMNPADLSFLRVIATENV